MIGFNKRWDAQANQLVPVYDPLNALLHHVTLQAGQTYPAGQVLGQVTSVTAADEVQSLATSGTPTGGTFRLAFAGQVTAPIAHNAAAAAVQAALEALGNVGTGNVACAGGALPTAVSITFQGRMAKLSLPLVTLYSNSLTGGTSPSAAVTRTTAGNPGGGLFGPYNDSLSDGTNVAKALLQYGCEVSTYGEIAYGEFGGVVLTAPAYFSGTFRTADMVGLDANGVADLGRLISGTTTQLTDRRTILRIG